MQHYSDLKPLCHQEVDNVMMILTLKISILTKQQRLIHSHSQTWMHRRLVRSDVDVRLLTLTCANCKPAATLTISYVSATMRRGSLLVVDDLLLSNQGSENVKL
jgi:hypothetical protein